MAPPIKSNAKPIFKTSSPFTTTKWPQIPPNDQEIILELACDLIAPLGEHRRKYVQPSKGKKRKRRHPIDQTEPNESECHPPQPEIGKHILIGLNSVTRHLESLAAKKAPSTMPAAHSHTHNEETDDMKPLSMIILAHPEPSLSPAHAHLPALVHLSTINASGTGQSTSASAPSLDSTTRLISLATSTESRLASKLNIPRIGALAIFQDAPGAKALETFVRDNVQTTECPWIDEALKAEWRGLTLKTNNASTKV